MRDSILEELISAYLDDEVTGAERAQVEQLLRESDEARQTLDDFRGLQVQLRSLRGDRLRHDFCPAILADPRVVAVSAERQREARSSMRRAEPVSARVRRPSRSLTIMVGLAVSLVAVLALLFYPSPRSAPIAVRPTVEPSENAEAEVAGQRTETPSQAEIDSGSASPANLRQSASVVSSMDEPNRAMPADTKSGASTSLRDFASQPGAPVETSRPAGVPYVRKSVNFFDVAVTKAGQESRVLEGTFRKAGLQFEPRAAAEPPHQKWENAFLKSPFARETVAPAAELTAEPFDDVMLLYGHGLGHQNDVIAAALESEPEVAVRQQFIWIAPEKSRVAGDGAAPVVGAEQLLSLYPQEDLQLLVSLGELTWNLASAISEEEPKPILYRISLSSGWHSRSKASLPEFKRPARTGEASSPRAGFRSPGGLAELAARGELAARTVAKANQNLPEPRQENARPNEAQNRADGQRPAGAADGYQGADTDGGGVIGGEMPVEFLFLIRHLRD